MSFASNVPVRYITSYLLLLYMLHLANVSSSQSGFDKLYCYVTYVRASIASTESHSMAALYTSTFLPSFLPSSIAFLQRCHSRQSLIPWPLRTLPPSFLLPSFHCISSGCCDQHACTVVSLLFVWLFLLVIMSHCCTAVTNIHTDGGLYRPY